VVLPLVLLLVRPLGRPFKPVVPTAAGLALALIGGTAATLAGPTDVHAQSSKPEVLLKDQFGKTDGPARHLGQAVLLIYGKVDGMRRMKAWEDRIRTEIPGTYVVLRGLDARHVRGQKTEAEVNERLQHNVPPEIALLVDWNGDLPRVYRLPDADVSVTLLDPKGRRCHTAGGPVSAEALEHMRRLVAKALTTGACP
jgi:hypothetical protein